MFLGIEGGGTRTVAILADARGRLLKRIEFGPANLKLLDDMRLEQQLFEISNLLPIPTALCIGLAGTWSEQDCKVIRTLASKIWPGIPCHPCSDLETGLAAAGTCPSGTGRVLVLSGTGSCCFALDSRGQDIKVGSGGHVLADNGSAFQISLKGLRGTFLEFEQKGRWPDLGAAFLRVLQFNAPDDLIGWANTADKAQISSLAITVLHAWEAGDPIAAKTVHHAAAALARDAVVCARRAGFSRKNVEFVLSGSMLLKQPKYRALVQSRLRQRWPNARVFPLSRESAWGAVGLAQALTGRPALPSGNGSGSKSTVRIITEGLPLTEQRNPRSIHLDKLPLRAAIDLMLSEEATVPQALLHHRAKIEKVIRMIVRGLKAGGRLFYVGAGTSGRIGVLDASECPPTFRTPPDLVQGIIAGGQAALWRSIEGAEDNYSAGGQALRFRGVRERDVVVGITASGTTPFVWGALYEARKAGAGTVLLCFNPPPRFSQGHRPDVVIAAEVGPEVLTGSTRLKCGTATKLLLNMFTTLAMARLGKVVSNLMSDMTPSNAKLRERAIRVICEATGSPPAIAKKVLEQQRWDVRRALQVARRKQGL